MKSSKYIYFISTVKVIHKYDLRNKHGIDGLTINKSRLRQETKLNKKMEEPKLTIGLPVYNGEKYVAQALESLINQSYKNLEIIISDNGSEDLTSKICSLYQLKDKRIKYYRQKKNIGDIENFIFVKNESTGKYFMWLSHDDVLSENWVECTIKEARITGVAFGEVIAIDHEDKYEYHVSNKKKMWYGSINYSLLRQILFYVYPGRLGKAHRLYSVFEISLLSDDVLFALKSVKYGPDSIFVYRILENNKINEIKGAYFFKRRVENSAGSEDHKSITSKENPLSLRLKRLWYGIQFWDFYNNSNYAMRIFLVITLPVAIVANIALSAYIKIKK